MGAEDYWQEEGYTNAEDWLDDSASRAYWREEAKQWREAFDLHCAYLRESGDGVIHFESGTWAWINQILADAPDIQGTTTCDLRKQRDDGEWQAAAGFDDADMMLIPVEQYSLAAILKARKKAGFTGNVIQRNGRWLVWRNSIPSPVQFDESSDIKTYARAVAEARPLVAQRPT